MDGLEIKIERNNIIMEGFNIHCTMCIGEDVEVIEDKIYDDYHKTPFFEFYMPFNIC